MLPFSSMGPKNTTSDSQKQPIPRMWDWVRERERGVVVVVVGGGCQLSQCCFFIYSFTAKRKTPFYSLRLALYLLHACSFSGSAEQSVLSSKRREKEKNTAHTGHGLKTEGGNRQPPPHPTHPPTHLPARFKRGWGG